MKDSKLDRQTPGARWVRSVLASAHGASGARLTAQRRWPVYLCFLISAFCSWAQAQYSIAWSTIDGGGGTSAGGVYTIAGTIGQPDAGAMSGGNFTVLGGFWSVVATVPTPGAPSLTLTANSQLSAITISWPLPAEGWVLQEKTDLAAANWVNNVQLPQDVGGRRQVLISPLVGNRFYRLYKP
ncbi:MAG TPA: hypothetical protein VJA21_18825 [Verrucomicrobiae bacterium]